MKFTKIHGLGNDYIYVDARKYRIDNPNYLSKVLSNRHLGIGSDGLILLLKPTTNEADFKMRIFNSDGSEAEMCGNGIRGLAKYIFDNKFSKKKFLNIETNCGIKKLTLEIKNKKVENVTVDMGEIILDCDKIPVNFDSKVCINQKLEINDNEFYFTAISVGNPHCVIFTENVQNIDLEKLGPMIENNEIFPNKTNVEFIKIIDKNNILMRVWERGSGETLACGTGATASVVAGILNDKLNNECTVHLKEGTLKIYFDTLTKHAFLTGSATKVFDGKIKVKKLTKKTE